MLKYLFRYSDGNVILKSFQNEKEMAWYAYNEGDHLLEVKPYKENDSRVEKPVISLAS